MAIKDDYYTLSEFARLLDVTRQTVSRWLKVGQITGERIGRQVFIPKSEFDKYEDRFQKRIAEYFINEMAKAIRETFKHPPEDKIEFQIYDGEHVIFRVTRKDGLRLRAKVSFNIHEDEPIMEIQIDEEEEDM